MPTKTILVLPSPNYQFLRWQVYTIAYEVGRDIAITALRQTPGLNARMLALGLSIYIRGEPGYREKLRAVVENDPSEESRAILALLPAKKKARASGNRVSSGTKSR